MSGETEAKRRYLEEILVRKAAEVNRRIAHRALFSRGRSRAAEALSTAAGQATRGERAVSALRRPAGARPRVIAELKYRSPSAGEIHPRRPGEGVRVALAYESAGASAVSVLADGPGFGGSPLEVRRVTTAVSAPVLFKEFVLDEIQVELAHACGAAMVLLLVRAMPKERLVELVAVVRAAGMEPVVEAANADEVDVALETDARIIGVNARDLATFEVDPEAAAAALERVGPERVAVYMSGVRDRASFAAVAAGRADAVLIGEGLMRYAEPGDALRGLLW